MDLARQLKQGISTGNVLFGQRQTISACNKGDARLVLVAANCPEDYISSLTTSHPDIPIHQVTMVNSCLLYTSPSPRDKRQSRMPSSA